MHAHMHVTGACVHHQSNYTALAVWTSLASAARLWVGMLATSLYLINCFSYFKAQLPVLDYPNKHISRMLI